MYMKRVVKYTTFEKRGKDDNCPLKDTNQEWVSADDISSTLKNIIEATFPVMEWHDQLTITIEVTPNPE